MDSHSAFIEHTLRDAGEIVRKGFGAKDPELRKENQSNIVTKTDRASESSIVAALKRTYQNDSILAEESGFISGTSPACWIVDPLDGTSNFAAGIPWFGILLARMEKNTITHAGMYLPIQDEYVAASRGHGTTVNGTPVHLKDGRKMADALCGFQADYTEDRREHTRNIARYSSLVEMFRNVRMTNSCFDFSLFLHGSTVAVVGTCSKLWDIAAPSLIIREAGGTVTDISGNPLDMSIIPGIGTKNFTFMIALPSIHEELRSVYTAIP